MSNEICKGRGPWASSRELTRAVFALSDIGVKVSELSDEEVLEEYRNLCARTNPAILIENLDVTTGLKMLDITRAYIKRRR